MKFLPAARIVSLALLATVGAARAHDPGLSALQLRIQPPALHATLTYARGDVEYLFPLDADHDGRVTPSEFNAARPMLEELAASSIEVDLDGKRVEPSEVSVEMDDSDAVHFRLPFPEVERGKLRVRSTLLAQLSRGHRQYFSLHDEAGQPLGLQMLDTGRDAFETTLSPAVDRAAAPSRSFGGFLLLGVEHILTGWDHLLFLLGLLIVGGGFREVLKIITAFTVAHSITLALATFNLIRVPASVVEPLIAASIIYVGIENVLRRDLKWRWLLAFGFGLIHGCGFASALRDVGIGANGTGVALPLLSFNLGVELGQLAVAALVLPLIWKLKRGVSLQPRWVPACSILIMLAGGYWLAERVLQ